MRKLGYLSVIAIMAFTFQSCNSGSKDSKETADSLNKVKDTTSNVAVTGGIAVEKGDAEFATKAAVGGIAEVEFGKIALTKTVDPQIKAFADMMVKDHGKANEELMNLATGKNITLPTVLDEEHQKKFDELSKLNGKDFDKEYVKIMVDGHKKTLDLMDKEAKDGKNADLAAFASKTSSIVKAHLDMIQKIHNSMK